LALGSSPGGILSLVLKQGALLAGIGVAIGLLVSWGITRLFANLLVGVSPTDPLTFGAVALLLIVVALVACAVPARQAGKTDPQVALHCE
jgi:ABC-type antimicrobial peptide transport system permease subunit